MIRRVPYQTSPPRFDYQLTDSGRALLPVLDALLAWGLDHAVPPTIRTATVTAGQRTSGKQGGHDDDNKQRRGSDRERRLGPATIADSHLARPGPYRCGALSMPGIDYLKAMIAGELPPPPMARLMQFDLGAIQSFRIPSKLRYDAIAIVAERRDLEALRPVDIALQ